uniref:Glycolipid transfer protein domain-containing protein n=1 Tax=Clastoptera arizonana TaxID=38151 RepID=A0A1B6BZZ4_9HEMI
MSASNGGLQSEVNNYFNASQVPFPSPIDGKLDTVQYLDASKSIVSLIEMFGKAFIAVRYDMNGNIEKLTEVYEQDKEKFKYLQDMIIFEHKEGGIKATDALLWLNRGLHLFMRFFDMVYGDQLSGEDLSPLLKAAYEETLSHFHGWMAKQLFRFLLQRCPTRTELIKAISFGNENVSADIIYHDMASFNSILKTNVDNIIDFYRENNLDPSAST